MAPKKSLGQNFLRDKNILKKIVDFANLSKEDTVLEIGPGEGGLTEIILEQAGKVITVEKDELLVEKLQQKFATQIEQGSLQIICADVLDFDLNNYDLKPNSYKLIGNIPYYITGAIFKKFLQSDFQPVSLTFIVQKEVADRITARQGKEGILSISIKAYGRPETGGIIKAGSFYPVPKVDSAIISISNINKEFFTQHAVDENHFFEILKLGFAHPRKYTIGNLKEKFDSDLLKSVFEKNSIDVKIRPEDLKLQDWFQIAKHLR